MISTPTGSEFLLKPRRSSAFGAPPSIIQLSTFPSGCFTSMWIHEWGLIHSIFVTVPLSLIGLLASNSAENAWCARAGTTANSIPNAAATRPSFIRIAPPLPLYLSVSSRQRGTIASDVSEPRSREDDSAPALLHPLFRLLLHRLELGPTRRRFFLRSAHRARLVRARRAQRVRHPVISLVAPRLQHHEVVLQHHGTNHGERLDVHLRVVGRQAILQLIRTKAVVPLDPAQRLARSEIADLERPARWQNRTAVQFVGEVIDLDDQGIALPPAAWPSEPAADFRGHLCPSVERNELGVLEAVGKDRDPAGRLRDPERPAEPRRRLRRHAALIQIPVFPGVGFAPPLARLFSGLEPLDRLGR